MFLNGASVALPWYKLNWGFPQCFSLSLNTFFYCIKHSSRPISSFPSSVLCISLCTAPSHHLSSQAVSFPMPRPGPRQWCCTGKIMAFNIWPLRSLMRFTTSKGNVQLLIAITFVSPFIHPHFTALHSFSPWVETPFCTSFFSAQFFLPPNKGKIFFSIAYVDYFTFTT